MASIIDELLEVLEAQLSLYNQILAISSEKKNIIIKNDVEMLQKMNTVENTIISKINRLEKKRLVIINDICMVMSMNTSDFGLTKLAQNLPDEEDKKKILDIKDRLLKTMDDLKKINEVNDMLIQNSLDYIEFSLNVIRGSSQAAPAGYQDEIKKMQYKEVKTHG